MTTDRGSSETPEERAARIQAAKERALAARQARESGQAPPPAAVPPAAEAEVAAEPVAAAPPPIEDDRPRTASGTLKRDPNEPKKDAPATPEERAGRVAAAKAAAAAAKAAREAGGGAVVAARPAAAAQAGAAAAEEAFEEAGPPDDGQLRTAKGTLKRDPNAPKKEPPGTPEERAARIAAAKAAAAAAKERAAAAPPPVSAAIAAAARPAARAATSADNAAFRQAYDAVMRPVPGAQPVLKAVAAARAERPGAATEFPMTEAMEAALAAFRQANPDVEIVESFATPTDVAIVIDRGDVLPVMQRCKTHPATQMAFLRCISGVDLTPEGIEVVYQLKSLTTKHALTVKTLLPAHDQVVDSVTSVWPGANWHERELMEMFGVYCAGHPDPRNLLLDEDLTIHPLLKAHPLADVELKQGVNVF
jgi:NADH-quinone oxidoreductase subunit C